MAFSLTYRGKWILITGASGGIGEVFAKRFAELGAYLVLIARSADSLKLLAENLIKKYSIQALTIPIDLALEDSPQRVCDQLQQKGIEIYGLINNAGCGAGGRFIQVDLERYTNMIHLNIRALIELTHLFLPMMAKRNRGFIINVSSTASFQPIPYTSVYAASKAFVTSFTEALWLEMRGTGVRILNLCPGLTKTNFGTAAGVRDFRLDPLAEDPENVVKTAIRALEKNMPTIISGWQNKILAFLERFLPHRMLLFASLAVQNSRRQV